MPDMMADQDFVLALLDTTPVIDGVPAGELDDAAWWCSMAACGNRMKARRHHRTRNATQDG